MGMKKKQAAVEAILKQAPVVPVMVIDDVKQAVPLARALVAGGLPVLEITLRTDAAIDAMKVVSMGKAFPKPVLCVVVRKSGQPISQVEMAVPVRDAAVSEAVDIRERKQVVFAESKDRQPAA